MKRMCVAGLIMLAANAVAGAAAAADLGARYPQQPYVKAPLYTPPFSWTGFYLGLNGGGGWGSSTWDRTGSFDLSGGVIGAPPVNLQTGPAVFGLEGDMDWSGVSGTTAAGCAAGCTTKNDWLGTAQGRAGYAFDRFLPYITGGLAFGDIQASTPGFAGASQPISDGRSGRRRGRDRGNCRQAEYLHVDLGSFNWPLVRADRHRQCVVARGAAARRRQLSVLMSAQLPTQPKPRYLVGAFSFFGPGARSYHVETPTASWPPPGTSSRGCPGYLRLACWLAEARRGCPAQGRA